MVTLRPHYHFVFDPALIEFGGHDICVIGAYRLILAGKTEQGRDTAFFYVGDGRYHVKHFGRFTLRAVNSYPATIDAY